MSVDLSAFAVARPSINFAEFVYDSALHGGAIGIHSCAGSPVPTGATIVGALGLTSLDWAPANTTAVSLQIDGVEIAVAPTGTPPQSELAWITSGPAVLTPDDTLPYIDVAVDAVTAGSCTFYVFYVL